MSKLETAVQPLLERLWLPGYPLGRATVSVDEAATLAGGTNFGVYAGRIQTSHQDDPWDSTRQRHILLCVMPFRGLCVLVRTDDGWGVPEMRFPVSHWRQLWPVSETIQWPPPTPVSDDDTQAVAMRYTWLSHPDVPIFHRDPHGIREITRN